MTLDSLLQLTSLWASDSRLNWNLEILIFEERGKPEHPEKTLWEQGQEPTTNSTHIYSVTLILGIAPGPLWWEVSALNTMLSLLPP